MKKILFYFALILIVGCQSKPEVTSNDYHAVYEDGELIVYNDQQEIIESLEIDASSENRIDQDSVHGLFFFAFYKEASVTPDYMGLCNKSNGEWIFKVNPHENLDYLIPNAQFLGSCHHNRFLLIEGGTGASVRQFRVFTNDGKVNNSEYYSAHKKPVWNESRMGFEYYKIEENYPDSLPEFTGINNTWAKKYKWLRGTITAGNEYVQIYSE